MKIGVFNSAWGNVGNAFFAYGIISLLRKLFPRHEILELDEPHPYMVPSRIKKCKEHVFPLSQYQDADVYVFSGPILAQIVRFDFARIMREIKASGKEYMILSASASEMSAEEIKAAAAVLNECPPLAFATRDEPTYEKFKPQVSFCHNGICGAFLIPLIDGVAEVKANRPYFVSSFYKKPEPYYFAPEGERVTVDSLIVKPRRPLLRVVNYRYARHLEFLRSGYPSEINGMDIVRVHQGFNPAMKLFNYAHPNSFVSYNPRCYLSVYKGCEFVVSDRVHACAAALAYGHPARLLDTNDRIGIFARMGIVRDENGIMRPLSHEKYSAKLGEFSDWLKGLL